MKRVDDIIGLWPSIADLGRDLGLPYSTVAAWKQRGSIPVSYWRELVRAARHRKLHGVTAELLVDAHDHVTAVQDQGGFNDEAPPTVEERQLPNMNGKDTGHFSRWKSLRRAHFASAEEITDHVQALRSEWDRR